MELPDTIDKLHSALINYEWFCTIKKNPQLHNSLIVYVDKMNYDILKAIPDTFDGFDIQVHYIGSIENTYAAKMPNVFNGLDLTY